MLGEVDGRRFMTSHRLRMLLTATRAAATCYAPRSSSHDRSSFSFQCCVLTTSK